LKNSKAKNSTAGRETEGCRAPQAFQQGESKLPAGQKNQYRKREQRKMNQITTQSTIGLHLVRKAG